MKKRSISLKKLSLGKSVVSRLNIAQVKGGDAFSRYSCGDAICIPTFDYTLGCPGQSDNCSLDVCASDLCFTRATDCCPFSPESQGCPMSVQVC